jgi:hypothetical protein
MAFSLKPRLSGENSIVVALATAALVVGIYNMKVGPVSDVHATDAMDINMKASVKKAGWEALTAVAGLTLLAQDPNIAILGGAAIIAEELSYRHALLASPNSGQIQVTPQSYTPAAQQQPVGSTALGVYSGSGSDYAEAQAG